MIFKECKFLWESPEAQEIFQELVGFPSEVVSRKEARAIVNAVGLRPKARILDVGCGTGRHAVPLAQMGFHVTAIDVARTYLMQARAYSKRKDLDIVFRCQRASQLKEVDLYDLALAYDHTLGFMTDSELKLHFKKIYRALKPGGKLFFKYAGPALPFKKREDIRIHERGSKCVIDHEIYKGNRRFETCTIIDFRRGTFTVFKESQRAFSERQRVRLLKDAGFKPDLCNRFVFYKLD